MVLLDANGTLLPPSYEPWYDPNTSDEEREKNRRRRPASPQFSQESQDCQFAVFCSEKQAKVMAMPSQTRIYKHNITETSFILRADVVQLAGSNCIACFCANGHIMTLRYNFLLALGFCFQGLNQGFSKSNCGPPSKEEKTKTPCTYTHTRKHKNMQHVVKICK